jgi:hypothetical protein
VSAKDSSNTHEVIGELFRAMNTKREDRGSAGIPRWADAFPYVNGELFPAASDLGLAASLVLPRAFAVVVFRLRGFANLPRALGRLFIASPLSSGEPSYPVERDRRKWPLV